MVKKVLSKKGISWKNYYETDIIDAWMYKWVQENAIDKLVHANEFYNDLEQGTLPQFSYINPECCTIGKSLSNIVNSKSHLSNADRFDASNFQHGWGGAIDKARL